MPKEITHWIIARKASIDCDPWLGRIIENNIGLYLAGAVAVDSPYYAVFGGGGGLYKQAGARLHGRGAVTPCEAISQIADVVKDGGDEALAFMLGAFTHLIADAVFHPMIYHLTGDYDDSDAARRKKAVTRHRTLETWLDVWLADKSAARSGGAFSIPTRWVKTNSRRFGRLASALFFGRDDMVSPALRAAISHSIIQSLFHSRAAAGLVALYGQIVRRDMGEFEALFYPPSPAAIPSILSTSFRYKNPVTGEAFEKTLDDLERETLRACARLFESVAGDPRPKALTGECAHLIPPADIRDRKFVHFAPEEEMEKLWRALSYFRTRR